MDQRGGDQIFLAYAAADPLVAEVMRNTARIIHERTRIGCLPWEDMTKSGTVVINRILDAIDNSKLVLAEISTMSPNVLFEVGYAIGANKHVMLAMDESDTESARIWKDVGLLQGINYFAYSRNSEKLAGQVASVMHELPGTPTIWQDLELQIKDPLQSRSLFLFPSSLRSDDVRAIDRLLSKRKDLEVARADEDERGYAPLGWFVNEIYKSSSALFHLLGQRRHRSAIHNARGSLLAGIARGQQRQILIVAEHSFTPPFDYQDLVYNFGSARTLTDKVNNWLDQLPISDQGTGPAGKIHLRVEFPVNFGEYVAEYEQEELPEYFVETAEYRRVLDSATAVYVGRKGTGKTATMLLAADELASDKRNLVAVIKPSGYELESLLKVLERLKDKDQADYFLDSLWQYLLHCEIAIAAVKEAEARPAGIASGSPMETLRAFLEAAEIRSEDDFSVRLDRLLDEILADIESVPSGVQKMRDYMNEHLHQSVLHDLRMHLGLALTEKQRVAVLIDNLDKAWERGADYKRLSRVIFGLLTAVGRLSTDFAKDKAWKHRVNVTMSVFLRADIFSSILRFAREPDKIQVLQIKWDNPELLARVLEDRYVIARGGESRGEELWSRFFSQNIHGIPARDYIFWRCLPRPRDLVYLCRSAAASAATAKHDVITESDILAAEREYSQFAFEALLVESDPEIGLVDLLYEFAGASATLSESAVREMIVDADSDLSIDDAISSLLRASFLSVEVADNRFESPTDEVNERKIQTLAKRVARARNGDFRYRVHPAYRPFLEISDDDLELATGVEPLPLAYKTAVDGQ